MIERLHRRFLDVVKAELDRLGIQDINNVQAMILYNIGDDDLTVGELTLRGYYMGSNVSYNVKKMVENEYIVQERSVHDKRSVRVRLSDKGRKLNTALTKMYQKHEELIRTTDLSKEKLDLLNASLKQLERFWASQSAFAGLDTLDEDF
ncbi:MAG: MarR family transcriptional regulator [Rhodospirillales bacterium]|nr:MarR family transcriptional regulator [Alphaproteobacteria bacterium]MCB9987072.1 MarR family transcriptional regulator [Rhodospirillales bacterium]USO08568.1 MAG: MarR family transcriptional regulator [Rhodospirillales bacterium]